MIQTINGRRLQIIFQDLPLADHRSLHTQRHHTALPHARNSHSSLKVTLNSRSVIRAKLFSSLMIYFNLQNCLVLFQMQKAFPVHVFTIVHEVKIKLLPALQVLLYNKDEGMELYLLLHVAVRFYSRLTHHTLHFTLFSNSDN